LCVHVRFVDRLSVSQVCFYGDSCKYLRSVIDVGLQQFKAVEYNQAFKKMCNLSLLFNYLYYSMAMSKSNPAKL